MSTVYECPDCGEQTLDRRCPDCNLFTRRLGPGGHCPHCDEINLITDLLTNINTGTYTENLTSSTCRIEQPTSTAPVRPAPQPRQHEGS
jgi:hypothetical protein